MNPDLFPVDLLPDTVANFARETARVLNIPVTLPAIGVLAAGSAALGRGLELRTPTDDVVRGNLYFLGAAKSGTAKSRTMNRTAAPLVEFEKNKRDFWQEDTAPHARARKRVLEADSKRVERELSKKSVGIDRAALHQQLKEIEAKLAEVESELWMPQYIVEDCTIESLAPALAQNNEEIHSMSADAGKVFQNILGRYNKEGEIDDNFYLRSFSADHYVVNRAGRPVLTLYNPTMSIFWLAQPDIVYRAFQIDRLLNGGLLARMLSFDALIEPKEIPDRPLIMPADIKLAYHDLITGLMNAYLRLIRGRQIPECKAVMEIFRLYHNGLVPERQGSLADINPVVARWHELAMHLAVVLHALHHGSLAHLNAISVQTAQNARDIIQWFSRQELRLLAPSREAHKQKRLEQLIRIIMSRYNGVAPVRDLENRHGFKVAELKDLANIFPHKICIEPGKKQTGPGRPSGPAVRVKA
jgi:Protein of unknown function (DUF3987)